MGWVGVECGRDEKGGVCPPNGTDVLVSLFQCTGSRRLPQQRPERGGRRPLFLPPNHHNHQIHFPPAPRTHSHAQMTQRRLKQVVDGVCRARFLARWGLAEVREAPRSAPLYLAARPRHFALRHELGPRDSLAAVALRYGCDPVVLRRRNYLMDDMGVACRTCLFVPSESGGLRLFRWGCFLACAARSRACGPFYPPRGLP